MAFSLPKAAKPWFKHVQGKKDTGFDLDFDIYYFCLVAGLFKQKKDPLPKSDTTEVIQQFPKEYFANKNFIIALFLKTELDQLGIKLNEKKALDKELSRLIEPNTPTHLSDHGMKELNKYAFGGFKVLQEYFPEAPRTLAMFLIEFDKMINKGK